MSGPVKDDRIRLIILSDIPQEPGYEGDDGVWDMAVKPVRIHFYVDRNTSFTDFQENIAEFPLIRYHVTKYNPDLANVLFVPDDKVYPPDLHASWGEEGKALHSERFQKRADLVYDNDSGRGWWAGVIDALDEHDPLVFLSIDWRALNTEGDWKLLMQTLKFGKATKVAYLYHLSARERINFVQEQVDKEKNYMAEHQGYKLLNFLLKRHRDEEKDGGLDSLCGSRKHLTDTTMEG